MKKTVAFVLAACMLFLVGCGSGSSGGGDSFETETTTYTVGTGQFVTDVASNEDTLLDHSDSARTLRVGAYGQNFVTSTLGTVGYNNVIAISCIYDTLFMVDYKTGEMVPWIAESYEYTENDDGLMLHIKIREEAKFQSGEPITAEDCYNSIVNRMEKVGAIASYLGANMIREKSGYEGDHDLYLQLKTYDRTLINFLSSNTVSISNASFEATATDDDLWDNIDGSGPFIVEEQISGDSVLLKVDDNYWGWGIVDERPNYDYMDVKFYSDATTMMIDFENEELDFCIGLGMTDTKRLVEEGMPHSLTRTGTAGNYTVVAMPAYNEVFSDPRVREAVFCAIDIDATADVSYGVLGTKMKSYVSSYSQWGKTYEDLNRYNPERAKDLLKQAGYEAGELELYTVVDNSANSVALAEMVQDYLEDVGITLKVDTFDFPTALGKQRDGTVDLCITTYYTSNCDISGSLVQINEGSYNKAGWLTQLDATLAEKMNTGAYSTDEAECEAAYAWVQDWLHENMWFLPIVEYNSAVVARDYVDMSTYFNLSHGRDIRNLDLLG